MSKRWFTLLLPVLLLAFCIGCSDSDDPVTPPQAMDPADQFIAMQERAELYINDNGVNGCPGILSAENLNLAFDDYTVIDIRPESVYDAGHIEGAYHSSLGTILSDVENGVIPSNKNIIIACYTGQSAGHAKIALKMLYDNIEIKSLGWGMASWNQQLTGSWDVGIGNHLGAPSTVDENLNLPAAGDFPTFDTGESTVDDVIASRVEWLLTRTQAFRERMYDDLTDEFIINYHPHSTYMGEQGIGDDGVPGHIEGAYQFTPYSSLGEDEWLNILPTDQEIVVYCWSGQHSSQVTAYLNLLGYDAYSLKFGVNNLFYDDLTGHNWSSAHSHPYSLENTVPANFGILADPMGEMINAANWTNLITAASLLLVIDERTIVDIRSPADFSAGRIEGAINSSIETLLDDIDAGTIPVDKDIVIVCASGQRAGHARLGLDLLYNDIEIESLKWGMAGWNFAQFGAGWTDYTGDNLAGAPSTDNENGTDNCDLTRSAFPKLDGYSAATVLEDRVEEMLEDGFKAVLYSTINTDDYYVINYFGYDDYIGAGDPPGHIPGAYQYTPGSSLDFEEMLINVPTDEPVLVYCWSGQTSSQITAYLNILGYDAYSLKFGVNNLFYSELDSDSDHTWGEHNSDTLPWIAD